MKLPEDPKQRTQILGLIGFGVVAALYLAIQFGIIPMLNKNNVKVGRIEKLGKDLRDAAKVINREQQYLKDNLETLTKLDEIAEKYTLRSSLGENYLLGATAAVNKHAKTAETLVKVQKVTSINIPKSKTRKGAYVFKMYAVRVTSKCGLHKLVPLLHGLEKSNPYSCISRLIITADMAAPEGHNISFDVQWPVWSELAMREEIGKRLQDSKAALKQLETGRENKTEEKK